MNIDAWYIAIPGSILFLIALIATSIGIGMFCEWIENKFF